MLPLSGMIALIDSGGANISSVEAALERLNVKAVFTKSESVIREADKVILPGVGAAKDAMKKLHDAGLTDVIRSLTQPVLGICLGMQLLFDRSEEGNTPTLGIVAGDVTHFRPAPNKTVPHMGWNNVTPVHDHPLFVGLGNEPYFYFVHSYFAPVVTETLGTCTYDETFTAVVAKNNFFGCQFHPERSGAAGRKIIENFLTMKGA